MNFELDAALFKSALDNPALRPRALTHVQAFLEAGGLPDSRIGTFFFDTLLSSAASHGWDDTVRILLAAGADVHVDYDGALRGASANGHLPVVERLLAAGANVHASDNAALGRAAGNGHLFVVKCLVSHDADVHADHDEALRNAAYGEHRVVVAWLFTAGADANRAVMACPIEDKQAICKTLDAMAAVIPPDQRQQLLAMAPASFPALRALCDAEQRRRAPTGRGRQPQPQP